TLTSTGFSSAARYRSFPAAGRKKPNRSPSSEKAQCSVSPDFGCSAAISTPSVAIRIAGLCFRVRLLARSASRVAAAIPGRAGAKWNFWFIRTPAGEVRFVEGPALELGNRRGVIVCREREVEGELDR